LNEEDYITGFVYFYDTSHDDIFISDGITSNYFRSMGGSDYIDGYYLRVDFGARTSSMDCYMNRNNINNTCSFTDSNSIVTFSRANSMHTTKFGDKIDGY
jgi:hypothetical protein